MRGVQLAKFALGGEVFGILRHQGRTLAPVYRLQDLVGVEHGAFTHLYQIDVFRGGSL